MDPIITQILYGLGYAICLSAISYQCVALMATVLWRVKQPGRLRKNVDPPPPDHRPKAAVWQWLSLSTHLMLHYEVDKFSRRGERPQPWLIPIWDIFDFRRLARGFRFPQRLLAPVVA